MQKEPRCNGGRILHTQHINNADPLIDNQNGTTLHIAHRMETTCTRKTQSQYEREVATQAPQLTHLQMQQVPVHRWHDFSPRAWGYLRMLTAVHLSPYAEEFWKLAYAQCNHNVSAASDTVAIVVLYTHFPNVRQQPAQAPESQNQPTHHHRATTTVYLRVLSISAPYTTTFVDFRSLSI